MLDLNTINLTAKKVAFELVPMLRLGRVAGVRRRVRQPQQARAMAGNVKSRLQETRLLVTSKSWCARKGQLYTCLFSLPQRAMILSCFAYGESFSPRAPEQVPDVPPGKEAARLTRGAVSGVGDRRPARGVPDPGRIRPNLRRPNRPKARFPMQMQRHSSSGKTLMPVIMMQRL